MKTRNIIMAICMAATPLLGACTLETSDNGKLDGFWHLVQVDTLATGGIRDMAREKVFWGVQFKLISTQMANGESCYFRFKHTGDSLIVNSPYWNHGHESADSTSTAPSGDIPVTDASLLAPFGINSLEEHFYVEKLTGSRMILRSNLYRLNFKKF